MAAFGSDGDPMDIAVAGAGIGCAAAAIALHQAGLEVDVFEPAAEPQEVEAPA